MQNTPVSKLPVVPPAGAFGAEEAHRAAGLFGLQGLDYRNLIRRNAIGIIIFAAIGAMVGLFKALSAVPIYSATATMLVEPSPPRIVSGQDNFTGYINPYLFYETQFDLIRSRALAERVVEKLDLVNRPGAGQGERPSVLKEVAIRLGLSSREEADDASKPENTQKNVVPLTDTEKEQRTYYLTSLVQAGVSVTGGQRSQILSVSYESPDPEFAAEVTNAIADSYIDLGMDTRLQQTQQATSWLTDRLENLRKKVSESEAALQAFQQREGLVDTESQAKLIGGRLETLNREVIESQATYADLAKRYGEKHPKLVAAKAELESAVRRLQQESADVVRAKQSQFELSKLEREVATNRELYNTFLTRFKQTDVSEDHNLSNVRIIDHAMVPSAPYKPNKRRILMGYIVFGLVAGVGIAVLREYLDNTFKTTADIETKLNLPVVGVVPIVGGPSKSAKSGSTGPERHYLADSRSSFAEAVNHVRTGVLFSQVDNPPRVILVTSSIQSEGKTTLSSNLALAFSQLGPTLLVDADLRKPRVAKVTGLERDKGLVEVVAGQLPLKDCIVRDRQAQNLYILKSGTIPPNPLEILSSDRFQNLVRELKNKFDHVVVDTAPLLPVSDALVAGQVVDGILLVVQAEKTTHAMAQEAVKRLRSTKINPLGVVLSRVSQHRGAAYYKDSYYYSTYYYGYEEKKS